VYWRFIKFSMAPESSRATVTGLGAACRAGAHVSCATGQESKVSSV
jgi:hypothetical protein